MSRDSRRFVLGYSLLLAVLLALPYLVAFARAGEHWTFTGFLVGVEDGNSYIAKMLRAAEGEWLFRTPYSTVPQRGVLAFLPYILLGKLAAGAGMHVQLVSLFHLFRILCVPLEVVAVYRFSSLFLEQEGWRRWTTVMATIGGGLGWALLLTGREVWLGSLPLDFHSPETFGFLSLLALPHLVLARALMLLGLTAYVRTGEAKRASWLPGVWLALLALVHPLSAVAAFAALGAHVAFIAARALVRRAPSDVLAVLPSALRAALPMAPILTYYAWSFSADPFLRTWAVQNRILSPSPWHYLIAFSLVLVPAVVGALHTLREGHLYKMILVSWVLALPLLAYAPTTVQRRLPDGIWVALVILAALGLPLLPRLSSAGRRGAAIAVLVLSLPTTLLLWLGSLQTALVPGAPAFRPAEEVQAFEWIQRNLPRNSGVATRFEVANALPAWAPVHVVAGHGPESADLGKILPRLNAFLSGGMSPEARTEFLTANGVDAVLLGPADSSLASWADPEGLDLQPLYAEDGYVILAVSR